jgi:hypothetical protein
MRLLQNTIGAIKHFQHRQAAESQPNQKRVGDWMNASKCIECSGHVPVYLNYFCETCWKDALNAKLVVEDATEFVEQAKRNQNKVASKR